MIVSKAKCFYDIAILPANAAAMASGSSGNFRNGATFVEDSDDYSEQSRQRQCKRPFALVGRSCEHSGKRDADVLATLAG